MNPGSKEDSSEMGFSSPLYEGNLSNLNAMVNDSVIDSIGTGRDENLAKLEIATLSVILLFAIVGNGCMLVALRKILQIRPMSRMYYFMLNLSVADLMVAFCNILPQLIWDITFRFKGPDILCRLVKFLQVFVLYLSTYVLTSMAVDRYLVVCHHNFTRNHYGALQGPRLLIIMSYLISFILASPQAFLFSIKDVEIAGKGVVLDCWVKFDENWEAQAYVTTFVIFAFGLPLLIIGFCYGAICLKFLRYNLPKEPKSDSRDKSSHSNFPCGSKSSSEQSSGPIKAPSFQRNSLQRQISQAKIKTLKLTLVVCISFLLCWGPFCITQIFMVYSPQTSIGPIHVIMLLLASLNSVTNPIIYMAFSESLCNQFRIYFRLGPKRGSNEESIGDEAREIRRPANQENVDLPKLNSKCQRKGHTSLSPPSEQGDNRPERETKSDVL